MSLATFFAGIHSVQNESSDCIVDCASYDGTNFVHDPLTFSFYSTMHDELPATLSLMVSRIL